MHDVVNLLQHSQRDLQVNRSVKLSLSTRDCIICRQIETVVHTMRGNVYLKPISNILWVSFVFIDYYQTIVVGCCLLMHSNPHSFVDIGMSNSCPAAISILTFNIFKRCTQSSTNTFMAWTYWHSFLKFFKLKISLLIYYIKGLLFMYI